MRERIAEGTAGSYAAASHSRSQPVANGQQHGPKQYVHQFLGGCLRKNGAFMDVSGLHSPRDVALVGKVSVECVDGDHVCKFMDRWRLVLNRPVPRCRLFNGNLVARVATMLLCSTVVTFVCSQ